MKSVGGIFFVQHWETFPAQISLTSGVFWAKIRPPSGNYCLMKGMNIPDKWR